MAPRPGDPYPYSRGDVASMCGVGVPTILNLQRGQVLHKRRRGTGHYHGYNFEDALRISVSKELLRVGLLVTSIQSLFDALDAPASAGKPWTWLRTTEARTDGAALVLVLGHPMGPDPLHTGAAYLTTAAEAKGWLMSKRTVIVVDVGSLIFQLEERTGERYGDQPATDGTVPRDYQQ
jgi:DNA-binding transcriptional MerR regulator